ncbi:hypothetical protein Y1Q_0022692 [Alligator mississippiensis]|uniref:Uncharacterized protein n=1 Tax=Alligator mississippiensis TaxID=8496 RepID=A0A151PHK3_ALLMI|nr:hypothetical protein Y1Q_0022692 [Alligator mississippiensis]
MGCSLRVTTAHSQGPGDVPAPQEEDSEYDPPPGLAGDSHRGLANGHADVSDAQPADPENPSTEILLSYLQLYLCGELQKERWEETMTLY